MKKHKKYDMPGNIKLPGAHLSSHCLINKNVFGEDGGIQYKLY
jgi:hypothetical protein